MAWRFITTQDGWQLSRVQKHCKLHVGKAELNTSCSYRWVQLTLLNHSQPLIHCILLLLVSNSVYTYVYIYNIYIPAKPLSRRRQNCHLSRSNFAPRAGETRFFFKCKKMHFDLRPPMNLSTSILRGRRGVL